MIHTGDCVTVMAGMPADSVDAVVTDPPYGLEFMGKAWDAFKATGSSSLLHSPKDEGRTFTNESGHMWDNTKALPRLSAGTPFQAWCEAWGREALRVTKPGGYLLAFGGCRTHHRLVCGLEDAGWIIRDELTWVYASGFPKGKANLKPAHEPIVLARKPGPLRALNIDASRIPMQHRTTHADGNHRTSMTPGWGMAEGDLEAPAGRWPSNLLLSDPELFDVANPGVVGSGASASTGGQPTDERGSGGIWHEGNGVPAGPQYGDSGGYSRFFIVPKADRGDREPVLRGQLEPTERDQNGSPVRNARCRKCGLVKFAAADSRCACADPEWEAISHGRENAHPTVKPTDLMRHVVRLVTPSRNEDGEPGLVLDCFLGSGSTAIACELEGFRWIGIEQDPGYVAIAEARLNGVQRGMGLVS